MQVDHIFVQKNLNYNKKFKFNLTQNPRIQIKSSKPLFSQKLNKPIKTPDQSLTKRHYSKNLIALNIISLIIN